MRKGIWESKLNATITTTFLGKITGHSTSVCTCQPSFTVYHECSAEPCAQISFTGTFLHVCIFHKYMHLRSINTLDMMRCNAPVHFIQLVEALKMFWVYIVRLFEPPFSNARPFDSPQEYQEFYASVVVTPFNENMFSSGLERQM